MTSPSRVADLPSPSTFKDPDHLTPIISIPTLVPAPNQSFASVNSDPGKLWGDGNRTIVLKVCSEWTTETVPMNAFDGSHRLRIVRDTDGAPIVFTLSSTSRLHCALHVEGAPFGYQPFDITPTVEAVKSVNEFDVLQTINGSIHIVAVCHDDSGKQGLYAATLAQPQLAWDVKTKTVTGFDPKLTWSNASWPAEKPISQVSICPSPVSNGLQLAVGTAATDALEGGHHVLEKQHTGWGTPQPVSVPVSVQKIVDVYPGNIWTGGKGLFTLYERVDKTRGCTFDTLDSRFHFKMQVQGLGELRSIFVNSNPWNMTDLVVASEKGIAFYDFVHPDRPPTVVLSSISFKQVVCAEAVDPANPTIQTKLALFAVSDDDELYYIRGTRPYATNQLAFSTSGIPIAHNVAAVSTQYNAAVNSNEIVYLGDGQDEVFHMWLDSGNVWQQERLLTKASSGTTKYPAYLTSVMFETDLGASIGGDYPVTITSSSLVHASVNGRARTITPKGSVFHTDNNGRIRITIPSTDMLAGPQYTISLFKFTIEPRPFTVDTSQRALRLLGNIRTADDLRAVKSTTGKPVLANHDAGKLGDTAAVLNNFPDLLHSADPRSAKDNLSSSPTTTARAREGSGTGGLGDNYGILYERKSSGSTTLRIVETLKEIEDWIDEAVEWVEEHILADVVGLFKKAVKTVFKFAVQVVGKVVSFVFHIAGKVLGFVVRSAEKLLAGRLMLECHGSVVGFLKDHLGLDLTDLMNWLSYIFDGERTRETHKVMVDFINGGFTLAKRVVSEGEKKVSGFFDSVESKLASVAEDPRRRQPKDGDLDPKGFGDVIKGFSWFFHNPIAQKIIQYNPFSLAIQAAEDGINEGFEALGIKLPSLSLDSLFAVITKFINEESKQLMSFLQLLMDKLPELLMHPSKMLSILAEIGAGGLWTLLESARNLVISLIDFLAEGLDMILACINDTWQLGWVSDLWDDFTGVPLTALNVVTYPLASAWNLASLVLHGDTPFHATNKPASIMETLLARYNPTPSTRNGSSNTAALRAEVDPSAGPDPVPETDKAEAGSRARRIATPDSDEYILNNYLDLINDLSMGPQLASCLSGCVGLYDAFSKAPAKDQAIPMNVLRNRTTTYGTFTLMDEQNPVSVSGSTGTSIGSTIALSTHFLADLINIAFRTATLVMTEVYLEVAPAGKHSSTEIATMRARCAFPLGTAFLDCVVRVAATAFRHGALPERLKGLATEANKVLPPACEGVSALWQLACLVDNLMGLPDAITQDNEFQVVYHSACSAAAIGGAIANGGQAVMMEAGAENVEALAASLVGNATDFGCSLVGLGFLATVRGRADRS